MHSSMKLSAEVCPLCDGTGWKSMVQHGDRRVTRCDCRLKARAQSLLESARIPKRYEHCELPSFTTDFPGAHPSLALAHIAASKFAQEYDPTEGTGLLLIGAIGTGKTHLGVGILKELVLNRGVACLFYDYRELLKQIQNSYNASVQATELDVLRPVFDVEVLVLDELGAVRPSEARKPLRTDELPVAKAVGSSSRPDSRGGCPYVNYNRPVLTERIEFHP